jgi:hypothetical protein
MTRGISEERLKELIDRNGIYTDLFKSLLHECQELSPWMPIDENTPTDRDINVFYPAQNGKDAYTVLGKYIVGDPPDTASHWHELSRNPDDYD